jgi:sulfur-oxidizing protein SoxX
MNARIVLAAVAAASVAALGCAPNTNTKSGRGFQMPSGDAERGKTAFVQLKCNSCHRVDGVELPAPAGTPALVVTLGGEVSHLRTYGDLVTAIIHPSRDISEKMPIEPGKPISTSPMKEVNREMTVAQLIDIVTFLEPRYRQFVPAYEGIPN